MKYFQDGLVLDIGCGNCLWNKQGIPVVGMDICESMLRYNMGHVSSFFPVQADFTKGLSVRSESVEMVVVTETLEHLLHYHVLIEEIRRVLKKGGVVISSVPYGRFPGLWGLFFPLWCRYKGWKDKDAYYRNRCGHAVSFNIRKLRMAFSGFTFLEKRVVRLMTLFVVARKPR